MVSLPVNMPINGNPTEYLPSVRTMTATVALHFWRKSPVANRDKGWLPPRLLKCKIINDV